MTHALRQKSLDLNLARILSDPACKDFILADAKDADMAFGLAAPGIAAGGESSRGPFRTIHDYRQSIRDIVGQGLVDIMLMSASTSEVLAIEEGVFLDSPVTPAVRMNDTTDIWLATGTGSYTRQPALPFATTPIPHARHARLDQGRGHAAASDRGANLGLFSVTRNDEASLDRAMLAAYRDLRLESEREGFRHCLEDSFPNATRSQSGSIFDIGRFLADL
ncbi:MAG: hypothetical protein ACKOES_05220, partial [Planctomycetaceae bacterium]